MIGTLLGGWLAARKTRRAATDLDSEINETERLRKLAASRDPTRRVDAMASLSRLDKSMRSMVERADAVDTLRGGASNATAAARRGATEAMAEATARIAAIGEREKASDVRYYDQRRSQLRSARRKLLGSQATEAVLAGSFL